jgi:hypothetical protein
VKRQTLPVNHDYNFAPFIAKYLRILKAEELEPPAVTVVKAKLGRCWLGLNSWYWSRPLTTHIEIDERVTEHAPTLERIFAHEMVHHVEHVRGGMQHLTVFASGNRNEIRRVLSYMRRMGSHGRAFHEGAAMINAVMGKDFVTEHSDQSYECATTQKSFLMLIIPLDAEGRRLGYKWGIRPSDKALRFIQNKLMIPGEPGARLVRATGDHWTRGTADFSVRTGWSVPTDPRAVAELRHLYDHGERMRVVYLYGTKHGVEPMRAAGAAYGCTAAATIAGYEHTLPAALTRGRRGTSPKRPAP